MKKLPGAIFIIDTVKEDIAVHEGRKLNIPIIALLDTNADPTQVDFPLPGNDDSARVINLVCRAVADAILAGQEKYVKHQKQEKAKEAREAAREKGQENLPPSNVDEAVIDAQLEIEERERVED